MFMFVRLTKELQWWEDEASYANLEKVGGKPGNPQNTTSKALKRYFDARLAKLAKQLVKMRVHSTQDELLALIIQSYISPAVHLPP